jgi:hypothetical protein
VETGFRKRSSSTKNLDHDPINLIGSWSSVLRARWKVHCRPDRTAIARRALTDQDQHNALEETFMPEINADGCRIHVEVEGPEQAPVLML